MPNGICDKEIYKNGNRTGARCLMPDGHKSACRLTTGYGSDLSSPVPSTGPGSSADTDPPRVSLKSIMMGTELYLSSDSVLMLLMDMHLQARSDGERELVVNTVESLRMAIRNG